MSLSLIEHVKRPATSLRIETQPSNSPPRTRCVKIRFRFHTRFSDECSSSLTLAMSKLLRFFKNNMSFSNSDQIRLHVRKTLLDFFPRSRFYNYANFRRTRRTQFSHLTVSTPVATLLIFRQLSLSLFIFGFRSRKTTPRFALNAA